MCNAWNHPSSCACGFGGVGHAGRRELGNSSTLTSYWWVPPITQTYESYVNPNAWCPVCGASVFFCHSTDGGRVFLDELGPPWPKHPCTNNNSIPKKISLTSFPEKRKYNTREYKWQTDGWIPFFLSYISRLDRFTIQLSGKFEGKTIIVFIYDAINIFDERTKITKDSLTYLKKVNEQKYDLSCTISTLPGNTVISAFSSLLAARRDKTATTLKEIMAERPDRQGIARNIRNRQDIEHFLAIVANCEIKSCEAPRLPKNLMARLGSIVASKGGVFEWAKSHPAYSQIKRREKSRLRSSAKIRKKINKDRKNVAAIKWQTKIRKK